jgi:hypothetical protein
MASSEAAVAGKTYKFIQVDASSSFVARITLNHPQYNVLTVPMMTELAVAIEALDGRGDIKCILLDSSQKYFSAGISVEDSKPDRVFQTLDAFNRVFQAILEVSKPLIVVVNGQAVGAGSELVAFGDMVIATPNIRVDPDGPGLVCAGSSRTWVRQSRGAGSGAHQDRERDPGANRRVQWSCPGNDQEGDRRLPQLAAERRHQEIPRHLPESADGTGRCAGRTPRSSGETKAELEEQVIQGFRKKNRARIARALLHCSLGEETICVM